MLESLIPVILSILAPKLPVWVAKMLADVIPEAIEIVKTLNETKRKGPEKLTLAIQAVGSAFDEALDDVPGWADLPEEKRDKIIEGLVELLVFISKATEGEALKRVKVKKDFRRLWRKAAAADLKGE